MSERRHDYDDYPVFREDAILIVDKREPVSWQLLGDYVGDIMVDMVVVGSERVYVIERKTVSDLWRSLTQGRLWPQLDRVKRMAGELGGYPVLLVVGSIYPVLKRSKKFTLAVWYGIQFRVMEDGFMFLHARNRDHARIVLWGLRKRAGEAPRDPKLPIKIRKGLLTEEEMAIQMLMSVRGIGEKRARALLERYGSVERVLEAPVEELKEVVGVEAAERLKRVLTGDYED